MKKRIDKARKALADPRVKKFENYSLVEKQFASVKEALERKEYALAWNIITNHEFWRTLIEKEDPAIKY